MTTIVDPIASGQTLIDLIHDYAAHIRFTSSPVEEWRWRVQVECDGQRFEAVISSFHEPNALNVVSSLWGITEYTRSPKAVDRPEWQSIADECQRIFGEAFGVSPKLPEGAAKLDDVAHIDIDWDALTISRAELLDWMTQSVQLTRSLIEVGPKLIERGQMTPQRLNALHKQLEIEQKVLSAESAGTTDELNEMELIWRTYMHRYAELHVHYDVGSADFHQLSTQARNERGDAIRALLHIQREREGAK